MLQILIYFFLVLHLSSYSKTSLFPYTTLFRSLQQLSTYNATRMNSRANSATKNVSAGPRSSPEKLKRFGHNLLVVAEALLQCRTDLAAHTRKNFFHDGWIRSEERRVGKEWRGRGAVWR